MKNISVEFVYRIKKQVLTNIMTGEEYREKIRVGKERLKESGDKRRLHPIATMPQSEKIAQYRAIEKKYTAEISDEVLF